MKKYFLLLSLFFISPLLVSAQDNISLGDVIGNGRLLGAKTFDGQTIVGVLGIDSLGNTVIKSIVGKSVLTSGPLMVQVDGVSTNIVSAGRTNAGVYQVMVELNTKNTLPATSGTEIGRGSVKVFDTIASPTRQAEFGFYSAGAGIFTNAAVFEIWAGISGGAADVSVRNLDSTSTAEPIFEVRDHTDVKNIALRHTATGTKIYTSGFTDGDGTGGIEMTPVGNNTWTFKPRDNGNNIPGNLEQNVSFGGHFIMTRNNTIVGQPAGDALTAAGTTITDALQLTKVYSNISTVGSGTGAKLFNPNTNGTEVVGTLQCARNGGLNDMVLYPPTSSDSINAGTAGHGISLTTVNKQIGCCLKTAALKFWCWVINSAAVL